MCEVFVPRVCEIWLLCCRFRSHELLGSVAPFLLTYYYTRAPLNYQQHPAYSSESYHDDGYHYDDASTTTTATSPAAAAATTTTKTTPAPFRIQNIRPPPPMSYWGVRGPTSNVAVVCCLGSARASCGARQIHSARNRVFIGLSEGTWPGELQSSLCKKGFIGEDLGCRFWLRVHPVCYVKA